MAIVAFLKLVLSVARLYEGESVDEDMFLWTSDACMFASWTRRVAIDGLMKGRGFPTEAVSDGMDKLPARVRAVLAATCASILQYQLRLVEMIRGDQSRHGPASLVDIAVAVNETNSLVGILSSMFVKEKSVTGGPSDPALRSLVADLDDRVARLAKDEMLTSIADIPSAFAAWADTGRPVPTSAPAPGATGFGPSLRGLSIMPEIMVRGIPDWDWDQKRMQSLFIVTMQLVSGVAPWIGISSPLFSLSVPGLITMTEALYCHIQRGNAEFVTLCAMNLRQKTEGLDSWIADTTADPAISAALKATVLARVGNLLLDSAELAMEDVRGNAGGRLFACRYIGYMVPALVEIISRGLASGFFPASQAAPLLTRAARAAGLAKVYPNAVAAELSDALDSLTVALNSICVISPFHWAVLQISYA